MGAVKIVWHPQGPGSNLLSALAHKTLWIPLLKNKRKKPSPPSLSWTLSSGIAPNQGHFPTHVSLCSVHLHNRAFVRSIYIWMLQSLDPSIRFSGFTGTSLWSTMRCNLILSDFCFSVPKYSPLFSGGLGPDGAERRGESLLHPWLITTWTITFFICASWCDITAGVWQTQKYQTGLNFVVESLWRLTSVILLTLVWSTLWVILASDVLFTGNVSLRV